MDKIIHRRVMLSCGPRRAFEVFTINAHLEKWLTQLANVEPRTGGKYELFWNPKDKRNDSTIGCKILAIEPGEFLCFEWKGPKQYKRFMNQRPLTNVVVFFCARGKNTEVQLLHTGWRSTKRWEEARQWFDKAWADALAELRKYVRSGAGAKRNT